LAASRAALIVAVDTYEDPMLSRRPAGVEEAEALARVLGDPAIGDFDVQTLENAPAHVIRHRVEDFFSKRRSDDLLLLCFSCHGLADARGELYFAAIDTRPDLLPVSAVAAQFVNRCMIASRSRRVVLMLDCGYTGELEEWFGGSGRAVITASSATGSRPTQRSVLTSAVVEGLQTGQADLDGDGLIGLDELYQYAVDRVRADAPDQALAKWVSGLTPELSIARRKRPAALPAQLQHMVTHRLPSVRIATIGELRHLAHGRGDLRPAARRALEHLAQDDDSRVRFRAAEALEAPMPPEALPAAPTAPGPPEGPSWHSPHPDESWWLEEPASPAPDASPTAPPPSYAPPQPASGWPQPEPSWHSEDPPHTAPEPSLYWNTRFPANEHILDSAHPAYGQVRVGDTYLLSTVVEPEASAGGISAAVTDARELIGTGVVFELQGLGVTFAAVPKAEDFDAFVRSELLECTLSGTRPFSVWCRIERAGPLLIEARLVVRNNKILDQRIELTGQDPLAHQSSPRVRAPANRARPPMRIDAKAIAAAPPIEVRLTVNRTNEAYEMRCDRQGWTKHSTVAAQGVGAIESAVAQKRRQLVSLSRGYTPGPGGADFELADSDDVLLQFAQIGAALHESLLGRPDDESVDRSVRAIATAIAGFGRDASRRWDLQIVSAHVPIPWGILYDARYCHGAVAAGERGGGEGRRYPPFPRSASDVDPSCFWGQRFNIARSYETEEFLSEKLGNGDIRIQPVLNVSLGPEVVQRQQRLLEAMGVAPVAVDPVLNDPAAFLRWAEAGQEADLLYFFCHATTPEEFDSQGRWTGGQSMWEQSLLGVSVLGGPSGNGTISLAAIRDAWVRPRERRPLVFLNACTSAAGDPVFDTPFVHHFIGSWLARAFIGTDWEIPAEFADAFSRAVVDGLRSGLDVAMALKMATKAAFAVGNPFGLNYALHGRSDVRFAR
jgi:hypothetical protein